MRCRDINQRDGQTDITILICRKILFYLGLDKAFDVFPNFQLLRAPLIKYRWQRYHQSKVYAGCPSQSFIFSMIRHGTDFFFNSSIWIQYNQESSPLAHSSANLKGRWTQPAFVSSTYFIDSTYLPTYLPCLPTLPSCPLTIMWAYFRGGGPQRERGLVNLSFWSAEFRLRSG